MKRTPFRKRAGQIVRREFQLSRADDRQLADMARRADMSRSAFLRSMIATHAKIEGELAAQRAAAEAEVERKLIEAARQDCPASFADLNNEAA